MVGAIIVKDGKIISSGYHRQAGLHHAEIEAINNSSQSLESSTMYVTLEPCTFQGKTPPCVNEIVKHKLKEMIIGCIDPNPKVNGRGIEFLKKAGKFIFLFLFSSYIFIISSCNSSQTEIVKTGSLVLHLKTESIDANEQVLYALISAHNEDSTVVFTNKKVGLHISDTGYISDGVELIEVNYIIDGIGYLDYKDVLRLLTPKPNTKASKITGHTLPEACTIEHDAALEINTFGHSPKSLNLQPSDFGYDSYQLPYIKPIDNPFPENICIRIGVDEKIDLLLRISCHIG